MLGSVLFTKPRNCFMFVYVGGGVGPSHSTSLQNGVRGVEPDVKIVKAGFRFFCSIFNQSTLPKISRTKRKCAQECSSGKKWFLKFVSPRFIWPKRNRSVVARMPKRKY